MYTLLLSFRYMAKARAALFSIGGVFVGVGVIVVVMSIMNGYIKTFENFIRGSNSDLIVYEPNKQPLHGYTALRKAILEVDGVRACSGYLESIAMLQIGGERSGTVLVKGINPADEAQVGKFSDYLDNKHDPDTLFQTDASILPVVVGSKFLGGGVVEEGDSVVISFPAADASNQTQSFTVVGTFTAGFHNLDSKACFIPLDRLQKILGKTDTVSQINVSVEPSTRNAHATLWRLNEKLNGDAGLAFYTNLRDLTKKELDLLNEEVLAIGHKARLAPVCKTISEDIVDIQTDMTALFEEAAMEEHTPLSYHIYLYKNATECLKRLNKSFRKNTGELKKRDPHATEELLFDLNRARGNIVNHWDRTRGTFFNQTGVLHWREHPKYQNKLAAVRNDRMILLLISMGVVVISGFVVMARLVLTVVDKTRDVGILSAIGSSRRGIVAIFLLDGMLIGVVGTVLGLVAGNLFAANIMTIASFLEETFHITVFSPRIYQFDRIPVYLSFEHAALIAAIAIGWSVLFSILPAILAAIKRPVEALRYE